MTEDAPHCEGCGTPMIPHHDATTRGLICPTCGWSLPDARAAAERLAAATDLPGLALQLRAWIAFSQQTDIPERYGY